MPGTWNETLSFIAALEFSSALHLWHAGGLGFFMAGCTSKRWVVRRRRWSLACACLESCVSWALLPSTSWSFLVSSTSKLPSHFWTLIPPLRHPPIWPFKLTDMASQKRSVSDSSFQFAPPVFSWTLIHVVTASSECVERGREHCKVLFLTSIFSSIPHWPDRVGNANGEHIWQVLCICISLKFSFGEKPFRSLFSTSIFLSILQ